MNKTYIEDLTQIMLYYFEKHDLYNASIINKQIELIINMHNYPTQNKKQTEYIYNG